MMCYGLVLSTKSQQPKLIMKKTTLASAFLISFLAFAPVHSSVKNSDIPEPLSKALTIYKNGGLKGFINALVKGGPLEGNQEMRQQVAVLEKMEQYYGAYQSYDIMLINRLSDSTRLIYFILNYEKGPVFGMLTAYKIGKDETITSFVFHTKAEKVFPETLLVNH